MVEAFLIIMHVLIGGCLAAQKAIESSNKKRQPRKELIYRWLLFLFWEIGLVVIIIALICYVIVIILTYLGTLIINAYRVFFHSTYVRFKNWHEIEAEKEAEEEWVKKRSRIFMD